MISNGSSKDYNPRDRRVCVACLLPLCHSLSRNYQPELLGTKSSLTVQAKLVSLRVISVFVLTAWDDSTYIYIYRGQEACSKKRLLLVAHHLQSSLIKCSKTD